MLSPSSDSVNAADSANGTGRRTPPAPSRTRGGLCRTTRTGHSLRSSRPDVILADKAYASGVNRRLLRERSIKAVIPEKSDQIAARKRKGSAGGRPPAFDADAYRDRNVVERSFALVKQWRGIATRYDKLATTYRAGAVLHACLTWAALLGDMPQRRRSFLTAARACAGARPGPRYRRAESGGASYPRPILENAPSTCRSEAMR